MGRNGVSWWDNLASTPRVSSGKLPGVDGMERRYARSPSAAAKQAAYRLRKLQAARDLATYECAVIQRALQTWARADQCWEMDALIDACGCDSDMPR